LAFRQRQSQRSGRDLTENGFAEWVRVPRRSDREDASGRNRGRENQDLPLVAFV